MNATHPLFVPQDSDTPALISARISLRAAVARRDRLGQVAEHIASRLRTIADCYRRGVEIADMPTEQYMLEIAKDATARLRAQADAAVHEYLRELGQIGGAP